MSEKDNEEKRSSPRFPIELQVEYKRLNTFFADYTRNIGKGGTFIKTHKPLDVGTEFVFKLYVPTLDEPLVLSGRVQWIIKPGEEGDEESPGMGIKFNYKNPNEKKNIEHTVERLMIESLGRHLYEKLVGEHSKKRDSLLQSEKKG